MRRFVVALLLACDASSDRTAEIAGIQAAADMSLARTRPDLVAGKYQVMSTTLIDYYRGSTPVYAHDARTQADPIGGSRFAVTQPLVLGIADPHPENFGALRAPDATYGIEPDDFDAADLIPYLYDLRRLLAGLVVATHDANTSSPAARSALEAARRDVARRAALAYARAMADFANGAPRTRFVDAGNDVVLADVLSRSKRDWGTELDTLTSLQGTTRTLLRGVYDPTSPIDVMLGLPDYALAALPGMFDRYRATLVAPPPPAEYFTVLDAARKLGSGVASFARVRVYVLVRGDTDSPTDDVVLEVKELTDSNSAGFYPPGVHYDDVGDRVVRTTRALWAQPDAEPLWGTSDWVGFPVQVRRESEGQKGVKVSRMEGARGTPEAIAVLGENLARIVARMHATPSPVSDAPAESIAGRIGAEIDAFADEQADVAVEYGDRMVDDQNRFKSALADLGPTLGVPFDPADAPSPDLAALYAGVR
jgi:uncharacterized protein (DUF2252 family)